MCQYCIRCLCLYRCLLSLCSLSCRDTFELYSTELKKLSMVIVEYMGKALKMDEKEMRIFFEDGVQSMRMNYYPPCPQPEKVIGLTPHSDGSALTILLQLNDVEGLQVRKDGMWVPVKPLPNAFIVNIGDILEVTLCIHSLLSTFLRKEMDYLQLNRP